MRDLPYLRFDLLRADIVAVLGWFRQLKLVPPEGQRNKIGDRWIVYHLIFKSFTTCLCSEPIKICHSLLADSCSFRQSSWYRW